MASRSHAAITVVILAATLCTIASIAFLMLRREVTTTLRSLEIEVSRSMRHPLPRRDLPPEVLALARRLGVSETGDCGRSMFDQAGHMWMAPERRPMTFVARQISNVTKPAFLWQAQLGLIEANDHFVDGKGALNIKALSVIPLSSSRSNSEMNVAEGLRYLAELPWNPDAILYNRSLFWTVNGPTELVVGMAVGDRVASVTLTLDKSGLVTRASTQHRLYSNDGTFRPWHGRFSGYEWQGRRLVPRHGEVAWTLDQTEFVYWRGEVSNWRCMAGT